MPRYAFLRGHHSIGPFLVSVLILLLVAVPLQAQEAFGPPREVRIGLLMTDLTEVNGAEQSFTADVFMLATWHDPELAGGADGIRTLGYDEVWHPTILIYNRRAVSESMPYLRNRVQFSITLRAATRCGRRRLCRSRVRRGCGTGDLQG